MLIEINMIFLVFHKCPKVHSVPSDIFSREIDPVASVMLAIWDKNCKRHVSNVGHKSELDTLQAYRWLPKSIKKMEIAGTVNI